MQYFWIDKSLTNEDFEYTINRCYTSYMQQTNDVLFNLLDSHDTKRLRSDVKIWMNIIATLLSNGILIQKIKR